MTGLKELDEALGELSKATARNVLRRVARAALEPIADGARVRVPVHNGDLRDSIAVSTKTINRSGDAAFSRARREGASMEQAVGAMRSAQRADGKSFVEMYVGAGQLPHAHLVEFGSVNGPPQAYMRPAWEAGKGRLMMDVKDALGEEIHKAAARARRRALKAGAR